MKNFFSLLLSLLFINLAFAQDSSDTEQHQLKHGIQFQIRGVLELNSFNGYTFSYRYLFNKNSGLRFSLLASIENDDYDILQHIDTLTFKGPEKNKNYNLILSVQYLHGLVDYKNFTLIFGGGPFISYRKREVKSESLLSSYINRYETNEETTGFGLDLILGVEYKLTENVILSGEYSLLVSKDNGKVENYSAYIYHNGAPNRISTETGEIDSFTIGGSNIDLGIAVFF